MRCGQGQGTGAADERRTDAADSQAEGKKRISKDTYYV